MKQPFFFKCFFFPMDTPQAIHEKRGTQQIDPADVYNWIKRIHYADQQVCCAYYSQDSADLIQMVDSGIDI